MSILPIRFLARLSILLVICPTILIRAQEEILVPGSNLDVKGVTPIPLKLARSIEGYNSSYGPAISGWDPDNRELWLKWPATRTRLLRLVDPQSIPRFWHDIGDHNTYDIYIQPQGKYLVYNRDTSGNEIFRMYLYNLQTTESIALTNDNSRSTEFVWSRDGKQIAFSYALPNSDSVDLAIINPFQPKSQKTIISHPGRYLKAYDWSPDNKLITYLDFIYSNDSSLWIYNIATGQKLLLSRVGNKDGSYHDSPKFDKSGEGIYLITDRDSDKHRLAHVSLKTKHWQYLAESVPDDIDDFELSPNGNFIAFTSNEAGFSHLYLLNTKSRQLQSIDNLPEGVITNLKWHNNSIDLAFNLSSHDIPNDTYSIDASTREIQLWFKSRIHGKKGILAKPELIKWKSFDGRLISGFLYRPSEKFAGPRPVIIDIHGGPALQYRPEFRHADNYFTNELGIIHIYPNVRGSSGYGRSFLNLDNGLKREDASKDIKYLIKWLKQQSNVDITRIIIKGRSYGGYLALAVAATPEIKVGGIIAEGATTNLATNQQNQSGWIRFLNRAEYGDESQSKVLRFMNEIAPITRARNLRCPILIIHGAKDVRVPISEALAIIQQTANRIETWSVLANDEGHSYSSYNTWLFRTSAIAAFISKNAFATHPVLTK